MACSKAEVQTVRPSPLAPKSRMLTVRSGMDGAGTSGMSNGMASDVDSETPEQHHSVAVASIKERKPLVFISYYNSVTVANIVYFFDSVHGNGKNFVHGNGKCEK